MIKRQRLTIIIGSAIAVVLALVYFLVIHPIISQVDKITPPELIEGELLGSEDRILLMGQVERADLKRLEVHNEKGGFTFYRNDKDEIVLENYEGAPYSLDMFSSVISSAGYPLAMERITTDCEDFSEYGLAEEDNPAWYEITENDGTSHKVWIGDKLVTGGGYYCRYDGRDAVYVLDTSVEILLENSFGLITPIVALPFSATTYFSIDNFKFIKDGECYVWFDYLTAEEKEDTASLGEYQFIHPAQYVPDLTSYGEILGVVASLQGIETVDAGSDKESLDEKYLLEKYGINFDSPAYEIYFTYNDLESYSVFSAPDEDGYMYAYSSIFNIVSKVNIASVEFFRWDIIKFVDRPLFQKNINDISTITVSGGDIDVTFTLDGSGDTIKIKPINEGMYYNEAEVKNFRQLYKTMLGLSLEDYSPVSDTTDLEKMATLTVVTDAGVKTVYEFYPYSTRQCFYTVNGIGEFYLLRDSVEKMLNDTQRMLNGEQIDSDAKN